MRKLWSNLKPNPSLNFREQLADLRERTDTQGEKERKIFRANEESNLS